MSVVAMLPDSDALIVIRHSDGGLDIPGGHTSASDVGPEDTARRECYEEASIHVARLRLIDVVQSTFYGSDDASLTYMMIYSGIAATVDEFVPSDEACERLTLTAEQFIAQYRASREFEGFMQSWVGTALDRKC